MTTELQAMARAILVNAQHYEWSLQGMGLLRLHLAGNCRLHVWDRRYRVPGVSMIHDHLQWALKSTVISGRLVNRRYYDFGLGTFDKATHLFATIKPGYGTFFKHEPKPVILACRGDEEYLPGQSYSQSPSEIHETDADDGTVTIMMKTPTSDESARVFWPAGEEWGSAEPRIASAMEVKSIVDNALANWTGA